METESIRKIEELLIENRKRTAFERFGLRCDLREEYVEKLTKLMVGYKNHEEKIWKILIDTLVLNKYGKENKKIAIIGPRGIGKTTLVLDIAESINQHRGTSQVAEEIKFTIFNNYKSADFSQFKKIEEMFPIKFGGLKKGIFIIDDIHPLFYPSGAKKEDIITKSFEVLNKLFNRFESSVIISTWTIFGWSNASILQPDLCNYFDEIIWLNGLNKNEAEEMLNKRLKEYCVTEDSVKILNFMENKECLKMLLDNGFSNPRLIIDLFSTSIEEAYKINRDKINIKAIELALEKGGINILDSLTDEELLNNDVLYFLLSRTSNSIESISPFLNLDRTTILRRLNDLVKLGLLKKNAHKKKNYYSIKKILQAKLEQELTKQILNSVGEEIRKIH